MLGEACGGQFILSVGHFAGRHFFYGYAGNALAGGSLKHDVFEACLGKFSGKGFCIFFGAESAELDVPVSAGGEVCGLFGGRCL